MISPSEKNERSSLVPRDAISAVFFTLLGLFYYTSSWQYDLNINVGGIEKPGPGLLPRGLAIAIVLCSLVILIASLLRSRNTKEKRFKAVCEDMGLQKQNLIPSILVILGIVVYLLLINFTGYLLTSIALIMFMSWVMGERKWWANGLLGLGSGLFTYWLFWIVMRVPLPMGTLWE